MTAIVNAPPYHRSYRDSPELWIPCGVDPTARLEAYVVVCQGTVRPTTIGPGTWIMSGSHVGHDCVIGSDVEISANVTFCGHCEVGDGAKIGAGATLRPFAKVGAGARVGAGAVVVKDVPAGEVWVGNPARRLKSLKQEKSPNPTLPLLSPWWCDCGSGKGYNEQHPPECYGEQQAFPRTTAAMEKRKSDDDMWMDLYRGNG